MPVRLSPLSSLTNSSGSYVQFCTLRQPWFERVSISNGMEDYDIAILQIADSDLATLEFAKVAVGAQRDVFRQQHVRPVGEAPVPKRLMESAPPIPKFCFYCNNRVLSSTRDDIGPAALVVKLSRNLDRSPRRAFCTQTRNKGPDQSLLVRKTHTVIRSNVHCFTRASHHQRQTLTQPLSCLRK